MADVPDTINEDTIVNLVYLIQVANNLYKKFYDEKNQIQNLDSLRDTDHWNEDHETQLAKLRNSQLLSQRESKKIMNGIVGYFLRFLEESLEAIRDLEVEDVSESLVEEQVYEQMLKERENGPPRNPIDIELQRFQINLENDLIDSRKSLVLMRLVQSVNYMHTQLYDTPLGTNPQNLPSFFDQTALFKNNERIWTPMTPERLAEMRKQHEYNLQAVKKRVNTIVSILLGFVEEELGDVPEEESREDVVQQLLRQRG